MAPSDGQISFTYGAIEVSIPAPNVGYSTLIEMPIDFLKLGDGTFSTRDEGTQYDKRSCNCQAFLTTTEQANLNALINDTGRGNNFTMTLPTGSGFFPFGPDKGDTGTFTVALILDGTPKITMSPWQRFICGMHIVNVGSYPAYSLPTEINDGAFIFGTVEDCRMPQRLFDPKIEYGISVDFTENSTAEWFDTGLNSDIASTKFTMQMNESKAAAIVDYLTATARDSEFNITTDSNYYAFGSDHCGDSTYAVQMLSNKINIRHVRYNEFEAAFNLQRMSG